MALFYLWFKVNLPFKKDKIQYGLDTQQRYTTYALWVFGTKVTIEGPLFEGTALYTSNHRSLIDPIVIRQYIKALGVAKGEIESYPIRGKAVKETGVIYVHRTDKQSRQNAKDSIVESLKSGYSVLLFPEGTVSGVTTTLPFRRGSFDKSVEANVPVVPIALVFNDPKFHWYNRSTLNYFFNSFGWKTPDVHIIVGEPLELPTSQERMEAAQAFIDGQLLKHANA